MKFHLNIIGPVLLASFCLLLYGLSGEAAWSASSPAGHTDTESFQASAGVNSNFFDLTAAFCSGNGVPLSEGASGSPLVGPALNIPLLMADKSTCQAFPGRKGYSCALWTQSHGNWGAPRFMYPPGL